MKKNLLLSVSIMLCSLSIFAQENNTSTLTIKEIMQGDAFIGHLPSSPKWSSDSKNIYFNWNTENAFSDSL
ncbi:hypothetical protein, partial [Cellulophaga fucicola]|uniref:hypothetical protein n=1 Tax=Cellulophaga fucicola TaxID=76595 RepID=UPI003EBA57C8